MDTSSVEEWPEWEYSAKKRIVALVLGSILFFVIIPLLLVLSSLALDYWLRLPRFAFGLLNLLIGLLLFMVPGLLLAAWAIHAQIVLGRGTPVPMMPPKKLIVQGPYAYCRNPMVLGEILYYLGIAILIGSFATVGFTFLLTAYFLISIKVVDEKKLEQRFGSNYLEYKLHTPFMIPRPRPKKQRYWSGYSG